VRDYYGLIFGMSGWIVRSCGDGLDALRCLDEEQPDLLVLDLDLPRCPGTDVYQELRSHAKLSNIPVLVITGIDTIPPLEGATVLRKPVSLEQIQRVLRKVVEQKRWVH
jgi:DNA-binding response OmpR family regulator